MPKIDSETIDEIVKRWIRFRKEWQAKIGQPDKGEVKAFVETMTGMSREFMSAFGSTNSDYYEALSEIAGHACADMRNPGMMDNG